mgnify:CR=1 FL=1
MNNLKNIGIEFGREINREIHIDKDDNIGKEREKIIDREIQIYDGEKKERNNGRIGLGMIRLKHGEMIREENQREFEREKS